MLIRRADGQGITFRNNNGIWQTDADIEIDLTSDAQGYTFTFRDGSRERYDAVGRQISETTPNGLITSFGYNGQGWMSSITGPFGHVRNFGYGSVNRILSVTEPDGQVIGYIYDGNNNIVRVNYPDATAKIYHYENSSFPNNLTGISYVNSNNVTTRYSTFEYNAVGKATLTQHATTTNGSPQEKFTLAYNIPAANQTTVTDPLGTTEVMAFQINWGVKNLTKKTSSIDTNFLQQTFDGNNNLTCRKDEANHVILYSYNGTNQKISMTEGLAGTDCNACLANPTSCNVGGTGRVTTYEYVSPTLDLVRFIRRPSVALGQTFETELVYGDTSHPNLPTQITQRGFTPTGTAVSRSVTLSYTNGTYSTGQVSSINGPRTDVNDITTLSYYNCNTGGACGQLQSVTNALGHVTNFTSYDANGRLLSMTDPNGLVTSYTYDPRGRLKTVTQTPASGPSALTQYSYTAWGDVSQVIDPDGVRLNYEYDDAHYLKTITDAAGNQIRYTYDLKGNRITDYTYDPSGVLTRSVGYAYDLRNHLSQLRFPGNATTVTNIINDALGNPTSETDPNNHSTGRNYDALNRLMNSVNALSQSSVYGYDVNDRPVSVTAPNNVTTTYSYDDLGNLLKEVSKDRGTINYAYDAAGNVLTVTNALGQVTTYTYDALNRVVTKASSDGNTPSYAYFYDNAGHVSYIYRGNSTNLLFGYDGLGRRTFQWDFLTGYLNSNYVFTPGGRLSQITYPNGRVVDYAYDNIGRVSQVSTTSASGVTTVLASNMTYQPFGPLRTFTFGNNQLYSVNFDQAYRPTLQTSGPRSKNAFYDAVGNLNRLEDVNSTSQTFTYDALNALTGASDTQTNSYGSLSYLYNANGNRGSETRNGVTVAYTYASNRNRLLDNESQFWMYAATGDAYWSSDAYVMGYDGYGRMVSARSGAALYEYDAFDRRTKKTVSGVTTQFHYGLNGELLYEVGGGTRSYVYVNGMLLARVDGANVYYYHNDQLGAPQAMTDSAGATVWRALYEPFGSATVTTSAITNNVRLAGQYFDAETGLHYNNARYYDPRVGRYITSDPIGLAGGFNTYGYVYQNPLRYTDSSGLCPFCPLIPPLLSLGLGAYSMAVDPVPFLGRGFSGQAETLAERTTTIAAKDTAKSCPTTATGLPDKLYHYTRSAEASRILENGLVPGARSGKIFTTPTGNYSPIEAQMFLALPPNRGLSGAIFEIDVTALRKMGVLPTAGPLRVLPTSNAMGSGSEFIFEQAIPSSVMRQVR